MATETRYTAARVDRMVEEVSPMPNFFQRTFFPTDILFEEDQIEFDVVSKGVRVAPFSRPDVEGVPTARTGYLTKTFTPGYINLVDKVTVKDGQKRRAGENVYTGGMSRQQRIDMAVSDNFQQHQDMIDARLELMAVQAITQGKVIVEGENYPTMEVDFGQDASMRPTLLGAASWGMATSDPLRDIEDGCLRVNRRTKGRKVDTLILDSEAWAKLRWHQDFNDLLDTRFRQRHAYVDRFPNMDEWEPQVKGQFDGALTIMVVGGLYEDQNGVEQSWLPANTMILASRAGIEGATYFGGIQVIDNYRAARTYSDTWTQQNPDGRMVRTQTAPLIVPKNPNAYTCVTVA